MPSKLPYGVTFDGHDIRIYTNSIFAKTHLLRLKNITFRERMEFVRLLAPRNKYYFSNLPSRPNSHVPFAPFASSQTSFKFCFDYPLPKAPTLKRKQWLKSMLVILKNMNRHLLIIRTIRNPATENQKNIHLHHLDNPASSKVFIKLQCLRLKNRLNL